MLQIRQLAEKENIPVKFLEAILLEMNRAGYLEANAARAGVFPQEADEQDHDWRNCALIDGPLAPISCASVTAYHPCSCPDEAHCGLRLLMVRCAQRDCRHPGSVYVGRHCRCDPAQDAARQSTFAIFGDEEVKSLKFLLFLLLAFGTGPACHAEKIVLRVGHFPNVTHAQAMIAHGLSRAGKGWFEERLGPDVEVQWFVYNAGPSAMEAIFARSIDLTYVGPNPAVNAHLKSQGEEIRIVAGACSGGAALVVHRMAASKRTRISKARRSPPNNLATRRIVAARAWLQSKGLRITMTGGDAFVVPTANPDQLSLFQKGEMDAVWDCRAVGEPGWNWRRKQKFIWRRVRYGRTRVGNTSRPTS